MASRLEPRAHLRRRILLLMTATVPALVAGAACDDSSRKPDSDKATPNQADQNAADENAADAGDGKAGADAADGSADPEPLDGGGEAGATDGAEPAKPTGPVPEGADFCFAKTDAVAMQVGEGLSDAGCPSELDANAVRGKVDAWQRRTGGPWTITVRHAADDGDRCCYTQEFQKVPGSGPSRGRPLIAEHRHVVPALTMGRARDPWVRDARAELGSVASFARASLELMQLGAPPQLLSAYARAAVDELEHARLCLARADAPARLGATEAVPPRALDHGELAARTLLEACIPETLGTLAAQRAAERAREDGRSADAATREQIADDETRHAALAWSTLAWALRRDPRAAPRIAELAATGAALLEDTLASEDDLAVAEADDLWRDLIAPLLIEVGVPLGVDQGLVVDPLEERPMAVRVVDA